MPVSAKPRHKKKHAPKARNHETIGRVKIISDENGSATLNFENGRFSSPQAVDGTYSLITSYLKESGKQKVVFEHNAGRTGGFLSERAQLCANFDRLAAIDTSTVMVEGTRLSVACLLVSKGTLSKVEPDVDFDVHAFYFLNVPEDINPEMVALDIALHNIINPLQNSSGQKFGIVMDSDLGKHEHINARTHPYLGEKLLSNGFELIYASVDSGDSLSNNIMNICDRKAAKIRNYLIANPHKIERGNAGYKFCESTTRFDLGAIELQ